MQNSMEIEIKIHLLFNHGTTFECFDNYLFLNKNVFHLKKVSKDCRS